MYAYMYMYILTLTAHRRLRMCLATQILKRRHIVTLFSENTGAQTFENDAPAAILGHIIIHTMSHHHTFGAQTFENDVPAARVRSICNARGRRKGGLSHQALSRT